MIANTLNRTKASSNSGRYIEFIAGESQEHFLPLNVKRHINEGSETPSRSRLGLTCEVGDGAADLLLGSV
jgi:hypothetical protein